jgi:hypothetical protein
VTLIFEFSEETWYDVINNTPDWDEFRIGGTPGTPGNKSFSKKGRKKKSSNKGGKKKR